MSANPAPGYQKYPGHRISVTPASARVQVRFKGKIIADSRDAVQMVESMEGSTCRMGPKTQSGVMSSRTTR